MPQCGDDAVTATCARVLEQLASRGMHVLAVALHIVLLPPSQCMTSLCHVLPDIKTRGGVMDAMEALDFWTHVRTTVL